MDLFGSKDLVVIALIVVLLWGGKKIPELARAMGEGLREFRRGAADLHDELNKASTPEESPANHSDLS